MILVCTRSSPAILPEDRGILLLLGVIPSTGQDIDGKAGQDEDKSLSESHGEASSSEKVFPTMARTLTLGDIDSEDA